MGSFPQHVDRVLLQADLSSAAVRCLISELIIFCLLFLVSARKNGVPVFGLTDEFQ